MSSLCQNLLLPLLGGGVYPSTITQYEYYSPLSPESVRESLREYPGPPCVLFFFTHAMSTSWVFAWVFVENAALAEALASFSGFRSFRIVLPLQRWPHFRASARSEPCSRCSAGLISALPLVPNRAPAAALASFPVPCHSDFPWPSCSSPSFHSSSCCCCSSSSSSFFFSCSSSC